MAFTRDYDLPPAIVWDALIDDELVCGWLAEASIAPHIGGHFDLAWHDGTPATAGRIVSLEPRLALVVETSNRGVLAFELETLPEGTRGTSTRLHLVVTIDVDPRFAGGTTALWAASLEQLDGLLRGHPVNWRAPEHGVPDPRFDHGTTAFTI